jgi:hypothetical protein
MFRVLIQHITKTSKGRITAVAVFAINKKASKNSANLRAIVVGVSASSEA